MQEKAGKKRQKGKRAPVSVGRLMAIGLALISFVGVVHLVATYEGGEPGVLSLEELHEVSPLLVSGMKTGPDEDSFIGKVADEWRKLAVADRKSTAEQIRAILAEHGVRELMLFNSRNMLQAHFADGQLRYLSED